MQGSTREDDPLVCLGGKLAIGLEPAKPEGRWELADRLSTLGALAAAIGHELNNPLTYVIANLHYLVGVLCSHRDGPLSADSIESAKEALGGAERAAGIVRDMRALARQDQPHIEAVALDAVLELAMRQTGNHIRHHAQLTRRFEQVVSVDADAARLTQVFVNLLLNAAQAIPQGQSRRNEVSVELCMQDGQVVVRIRDTGQGIPADVLPRVFEAFFTTKPVGEGTGLGLAISRSIVRSFGGELTIDSHVGSGTTVCVRLPAGKLGRTIEGAAELESDRRPQSRARILVIDDDPLVLDTIVRILGDTHDVSTQVDARDAMRQLATAEPFDLIVCDLLMPNMTGMELHAQLYGRAPELAERMVFMTGGAFTPDSREFLARVRCLNKPFAPKALFSFVNSALASLTGTPSVLPPANAALGSSAEFALKFSKRWSQLAMVRESCGFFARAACADVGAGQRVSLVVHELVEGAIRDASEDEHPVEVGLVGAPSAFEVAVSHRSSREHGDRLLSLIAELQSADPHDAYLRAVRRCAQRSSLEQEEDVALPLARIAYEAQVQLSAGFFEGRMRVVARGVL